MRSSPSPVSLMLAAALLFVIANCAPHAHKHRHGHDLIARDTAGPSSTIDYLADSATPCSTTSCVTPTALQSTITCPANNNSAYASISDGDHYTILCDVDFVGQNIFPFVLATSFENCMSQCETYNNKNGDSGTNCAGFVFAPGRINDADNCYLKSALNSAVPATIPLVGATLVSSAPTSSLVLSLASTASPDAEQITNNPSTVSTTASATTSSKISVPIVGNSQLLGVSENNPTSQYVEHPPANPMKLATKLLTTGIDTSLIANYPIAGDTGTLIRSPGEDTLADLNVIPHLSRDGGKGGQINGTQVLIFCDTAGFTTTSATTNGSMVSFVSSTVAIDSGMNGLNGKALSLIDGIGAWQDAVGHLRGYAPMTTGEESFNIAMSGNGYRYAVWPETSLISLNSTHSIQYASLVYDEVDMDTQAANFTTLGNTLLTVWVDPQDGPVAQRTVNLMFSQDEVQWGSIGGIRSWGSSGVGGTDGQVYFFGQTDAGLLLARTSPASVAHLSQYTYWDGSNWSSGMLSNTSTAVFFANTSEVMDIDIFYSPHHATFIAIYLTCDVDNTFYYRYLQAPSAIVPPYASSGDANADYVENLVQHSWSEQNVLYKPPPPAVSYLYAGAVHAGYFGDGDITNGGTKMLLSWTEHTGQDAASPPSGYNHITAMVELE